MRLNITRLCAVLAFSSVVAFAGTAGAVGPANISVTESYTSAAGTVGTNSTLQVGISVTNLDAAGGAFTYTAPAGLTVTSAPISTGGCFAGFTSSFTASLASVSNLLVTDGNNCVLQFTVQPTTGGVYTALPKFSNFTYNAGASAAFTNGANPTLTVPGGAAAVPTLSQWALILLGLIFAGGAVVGIERRRQLA